MAKKKAPWLMDGEVAKKEATKSVKKETAKSVNKEAAKSKERKQMKVYYETHRKLKYLSLIHISEPTRPY